MNRNGRIKQRIIIYLTMMLLAFLQTAITPPLAHAQPITYYVATNGNDNNPGTLAKPLATLQKAVNKAKAGDTINVRGGLYTLSDKIYIGRIGTPNAWITIQAYQTEKPILDCSQTSGSCVTLAGEYLEFHGFEVRNAQKAGVSGWNGKHLRILNNTIHHSVRGGIWVGHEQPDIVTDILISGNTLYENSQENNPPPTTGGGGWPAALLIQYATDVTVSNNKVHQNFGEGIVATRSEDVRIVKNSVHDNFAVNIYVDAASYITIDSNLIYSENDARFFRFDIPAKGISIGNEGYTPPHPPHHNIVKNNIVVGSGRSAFAYTNFQEGGGLKDSWIVNNTFYESVEPLFRIDEDAHERTVIANNIIYQTSGMIADVPSDLSGLTFRHNLWYGGKGSYPVGTGDIVQNPLLRAPGSNNPFDYCLQPTSPAINAGAPIPQVTNDFFANFRLAGGYDFGACEHLDGHEIKQLYLPLVQR